MTDSIAGGQRVNSPRRRRVDLMRVVAICFILLHHADDYGLQFLRLNPLLARFDDVATWAALALFFTLSGYLAMRPDRDLITGWTYVARRFGRLYVPFAVALLLLKVLGVFRLQWTAVLLNLALLGPWIGPNVGTLWFVEVLLYFQVLVAVWTWRPELRSHSWSLPLVAGAATAALAWAANGLGGTVDGRLAIYLPAFVGGACVGLAMRQDGAERPPALLRAALAIALSVATGIALFALDVWSGLEMGGTATACITMALAGGVMFLPRRPIGPVRHGLWRTVELVAHGSFMAYLVHRFVYWAAANVARPLGPVWTDVVVVATIPLVLYLGVAAQRIVDGRRAAR